MPGPAFSLAGAGAGAGALGLAGAGALSGAGALAASIGLNANGNLNGNENGNGNGNGNLNGNGNVNADLNANANLNAAENLNSNTNTNTSTTTVTTDVTVDLTLTGEVELSPPSIEDSYNLCIDDSIFIPEPGCGDIVVANNGSSAAIYNGDVYNFGGGGGTQTVFDLTQANTLADMDALCGASVTSTGSNFVSFIDGVGGGGPVDAGDGIGSADDVLHATTNVAATADASAAVSAFNQNIVMGANVQYNSATQTVVGGNEITHGDLASD
jgi:hypothetical protein